MAEFMKQILEAFKTMNKKVESIQPNISEIMDIANFNSNTHEVVTLLITECSVIKAKLANYEVAKKNDRFIQKNHFLVS
jgi:hypothetical protein